MWGSGLAEYLAPQYSANTPFVVIFISKEYAQGKYPTHERKAAFAAALQGEVVILPVRFDDTPLPALNSDVHYLEASEYKPKQLADLIGQRLELHGCKLNERLVLTSEQELGVERFSNALEEWSWFMKLNKLPPPEELESCFVSLTANTTSTPDSLLKLFGPEFMSQFRSQLELGSKLFLQGIEIAKNDPGIDTREREKAKTLMHEARIKLRYFHSFYNSSIEANTKNLKLRGLKIS